MRVETLRSAPPLSRCGVNFATVPGNSYARLLECLPESLGRLGTGYRERAVDDEEWYARNPEPPAFFHFGTDSFEASVAGKQIGHFLRVEAGLDRDRR